MSRNPIRILLIEDNPGDARIIREFLNETRTLPFALQWCESLNEGLLKLKEKGADVVLTDLNLPDSQGLDTYHKLHAQFPELPIVVLSGLDDESVAVNAVSGGAQDYLVKGQINGKLLSRCLKYAIERKKSEKAVQKAQREWERTFDAVPDLIAIVDTKHQIIRANRSMNRFLGLNPQQIIGSTCYKLVHRTDVPPDSCPHVQTLNDGLTHVAEFYMDSVGRDLLVTCVPLCDENAELLGSVHVARDITERKQSEAELRKAYFELEEEIMCRKQAEEELIIYQEKLRNLYLNLQAMREYERANIAREIHDELGQTLTAIKMQVAWMNTKYSDHEGILDKTSEILSHIDTTIKSIKKICTELRPGILDHLGLVAAIKWQAQEFQKRTGIQCKVEAKEDIDVDSDRSTALFRIFQEALTNVLRHAVATEVTASIKCDDGLITLKVSDNGRGISEAAISKPNSFGLLGMRERVYPWKGTFNVTGSPNKGTTVEVVLPLV